MCSLDGMKCEVCRVGAQAVEGSELDTLREQTPDWLVIEVGGVKQIQRIYKFKDFKGALEFTDKVGALAEENGHHPSILTEWGSVTVTYWTHKIQGLHKSDFIMAAKTDKLYGG